MKYRLCVITLLISLLFGCSTFYRFEKPPVSLIPMPVSFAQTRGVFLLTEATVIRCSDEFMKEAELLQDLFYPATGWKLQIELAAPRTEDSAQSGTFIELSEKPMDSEEGYHLSVSEKGVRIQGASSSGVFYGIQTLRQLMPPEIESDFKRNIRWKIPNVEIKDSPRYSWRGNMLDSVRHFQSIDYIKQHIDRLGMLKMNVFHWHLTDDQGWRVEIKSRPELTRIGGFRTEQNGLYGGYYTQDEIREVVEYAERRHIQVIPEIDMPGHASAVLAAYPELSCHGDPVQVQTNWGVFPNLICPSKDSTYAFIQDVIFELSTLFNSSWIHVGGDEVQDFESWQTCPDCQRRAVDLGGYLPQTLQKFFFSNVEEIVSLYDKKVILWNDGAKYTSRDDTALQYWLPLSKPDKLLEAGRKMIYSKIAYTYLDQKNWSSKEDRGLSIQKAYSIDPLKDFPDYSDSLLGIEACLWTEWTETEGEMDYKIYPRITALAERMWTPQSASDWESFQGRLSHWPDRFHNLGISFYPSEEIDWVK